MDKQIRKNIDELANNVYNLLSPDQYPSLENALERAGIDVRYFSDQSYDGFLEWDAQEKRPVISVNATHPNVRQRFSIAHELGHLIINWGWIPFSSNADFHPSEKVLNVTKYRGASYSAAEKKEEILVNEFAASFLVSNSVLKEIILGNDIKKIGYRGIVEKITEKCHVSSQNAIIRLDNFLDLAVEN